MEKELFKTSIELVSKINTSGPFNKAIMSYLEDNQDKEVEKDEPIDSEFGYIQPLKELILKQPDLLYVVSTFASQGNNKNNDVFLRSILAKIFETPKHKFVDFEHDSLAENFFSNPNQYKVVGHIYDSILATQETDSVIPSYELVMGPDGKLFSTDSPYRNQALDVVVAWVLYQFEYPELADLIVKNYAEGDNGKFGVSMEVLFSNYKFRVGEVNPDETFEHDGNADGYIEAVKGTPLADKLKPYWEKRKQYNGKTVYRILGGDIFFSGMAITSNRAGERSSNKSIASIVNDFTKSNASKEILSLIRAISSKNSGVDMSKCEIIDGEPSCGCLEKSIAAQIEEISKALAAIKKRKDISPKRGITKYGDVKFADTVNNKYPIDTEKHIRAGWNYINNPRNSSKYSAKDLETIKNRIIAAWKKMIDKNGPPSSSKAEMSNDNSVFNENYFINNTVKKLLIETNDLMAEIYDDGFASIELIDDIENITNVIKKIELFTETNQNIV